MNKLNSKNQKGKYLKNKNKEEEINQKEKKMKKKKNKKETLNLVRK